MISQALLGSTVRRYGERKNITQEQLSRETGLTINYLSLFENGHRGISIENSNLIARVLNVRASRLYVLADRPDAPQSSR
jgi:transcriptional regulator with XRE-family HTH domain